MSIQQQKEAFELNKDKFFYDSARLTFTGIDGFTVKA